MLSEILNNSKFVIGVVSNRYNSSLSSYLRFMAKSHGFNTKSIKRIEKIEQVSKEHQFLVKGPTMLLYTNLITDFQLLNKIKSLSDFTIIFISIYGYVFLSDNLKSLNNIQQYQMSINSSIYNLLCNINITHTYNYLIMLLDAYSKSATKRD